MDRPNFPSINRDRDFNEDLKSGSIFENTAIEANNYSYGKQKKGPKGVKRNTSANKNTSEVTKNNGPTMNNNLFKSTSDGFDDENSVFDVHDRKLVPMGYFDKSPNTVSEINTTSRFNENRMATIELPMLHNTLRTETLYSIKSMQNRLVSNS